MSDENLVKRLRGTPLYYGSGEDSQLGETAADRIEELEGACRAYIAEIDRLRRSPSPDVAVEALEPFAKLADVIAWRTGLKNEVLFRTIMVSLWDDIAITIGDLRPAPAPPSLHFPQAMWIRLLMSTR